MQEIINYLIFNFSNKQFLLNMIMSIVGGVLASLFFYIISNHFQNKRWRKVKKKLIDREERISVALLTSIRVFYKIPYDPKIKSTQDYYLYLENTLNKDYDKLYDLSSWNKDSILAFLNNLSRTHESIMLLLPLLLSFKKSHNELIEFLFTLEENIQSISNLIHTYPEVYESFESKYDDLRRILRDKIIVLTSSTMEINKSLRILNK